MPRTEIAVVGAGPAGVAAAIAATKAGKEVTLIDENPIDIGMMGLDIPYLFGQRMMPTVRDKGLMLQRFASANPAINTAEEAGVKVLLGTYVWGSFRKQPNSQHLSSPTLGLANEQSSWLLEYDRLVLATGARDLVFGFAGRDLAGVMGAQAVASLVRNYSAFTGKRMVIIGSGTLAMSTANTALDKGIEVAAIIEAGPSVISNRDVVAKLKKQGVSFHTSHTISEVKGIREVESVVIAPVGQGSNTSRDKLLEIPCDTVCLSIGLVPNVELAVLTGCETQYDSKRGGNVPNSYSNLATNVEGVFTAGDVSGIDEQAITDPTIASNEGSMAGLLAANQEIPKSMFENAFPTNTTLSSVTQYWEMWHNSLKEAGSPDVNVCQCENVTRADILQVSPPAYLEWAAKKMGCRDLGSILGDSRLDMEQLKRLTRAGMGYCQGRRCREEIAFLVAESTGTPPWDIPIASFRCPVRPLPLNTMWDQEETEQTRDDWSKWFKPVS